MLILSNDDVRAVLPMAEALGALEQAYRDFANGRAQGTTTRLDTRVTLSDTGRFFSFMSMEGTTPDGDLMALRFNANHEMFVTANGKTKKAHLPPAPGARYLGLVLLVAMRDTRPLAMIHDGYLSALRVGATSALAARYLSRTDAGDVALFGCGDQARAQLLGLAEVRRLRKVRVFSRNEARRVAFVEEMGAALGLPVIPMTDPRAAVEGADLVVAATNSLDPVFSAEWLADGAHVGAIVPGEVDSAMYQRSHVTAVNSKVPFGNERSFIARDDRDWTQYPDLGEVVTGCVAGRSDQSQITFFMNNAGLGFQFAACAAKIWASARERGLGHEVPTDWLLQPLSAWTPRDTETL
ncbi:MAG: ornithine cyclodeaminase family protein [Chloroflexi bacterium]|nr:ornithine cyclodeaminase family protein [Chloroflexota bacterium]